MEKEMDNCVRLNSKCIIVVFIIILNEQKKKKKTGGKMAIWVNHRANFPKHEYNLDTWRVNSDEDGIIY